VHAVYAGCLIRALQARCMYMRTYKGDKRIVSINATCRWACACSIASPCDGVTEVLTLYICGALALAGTVKVPLR
jgi:hypothetical protein